MAATDPQAMILRVVDKHSVRKVKLSSRPASVDDLINVLKDQLNLDLNFNLLYEDPDFDGKLTSLVDIDELPQKAVVHISFTEHGLVQKYSQMCHPLSILADGLQTLFQFQHFLLMLS